MPYNELNLSPLGYIVLALFLVILLTCLLLHKSTFTILPNNNNKTDNEQPKAPEYNANYGAYIQAQGRYYN